MFPGRLIPAVLNVPGVLDRTLWVFRHRYYPYLMINMVAYGIPFLVMVGLVVFGVIDFSMGRQWQVFNDPRILFYLAFFSLPSFCSDIAMSHYTAALVREEEITWGAALRRSLNLRLLSYFVVKVVGFLLVALVSSVAFIVNIVPVLGQVIYVFVVISLHTFMTGFVPGILVEEKKGLLRLVGRNMRLAQQAHEVTSFASTAGFFICMGFIAALSSLTGILGFLVASLGFGETFHSIMEMESEVSRVVLQMVLFSGILLGILIYIPLQSVFFSVLYYSMRSRLEGFHLENRIRLYARDRESQADTSSTTA